MPVNKNALIRYKRIDQCLSNPYRKWTLEDLVEECANALYEYEGIRRGVSVRTIQGDIQMMRSDKLGYEAPIEVYGHKYYRYSDPNYSITKLPISHNDIRTMKEAVEMLKQFEDFDHFAEMSDVVSRLQDNLSMARGNKSIVDFERNSNLKGLNFLNPLYGYISNRIVITVKYKPFKSDVIRNFTVHPHLLKEYRNRWFLFATDNLHQYIMSLALDRIEGIDEEVHIPYRDNPQFNPHEYFKNIIGVTKVGNVETVTFLADKDKVGYLKTKPIHSTQSLKEEREDGSAIFEVSIEPNFEFYELMMGKCDLVTILSPQIVVEEVRRKLAKAVSNYKL